MVTLGTAVCCAEKTATEPAMRAEALAYLAR